MKCASEGNSSRAKKFITDILVYAIGTLGSKLITFMLVPLYTLFIAAEEYGYYDISLSITLVLMGVVCVQMNDGIFRFLIDAKDESEKKNFISSVYSILFRNYLILCGIAYVLSLFFTIPYLWVMVILLILMGLYEIQTNIYRGIGLNKYFAIAGILTSFLLFALVLIFVVWLKMGIMGIFIAHILARILSLSIIELKLGVLKTYLSIKSISSATSSKLLKYSFPLMINGLCWWVINSSNKVFISNYIGLEENGKYAVVVKFASILMILSTIFYKAWQENALQQYHSPDRNKFFSSIFNTFVYGMCFLVMVFCFVLKIFYPWIVDSNYSDNIIYLYPLVFSSMIYCINTFFELGYQCSHNTARSMPSIMIAGGVNLIGNFVLIKFFGTFGIIASSIISFSILLIYRAIETRRYFKINISLKSWLMFAFVIASGVTFYFTESLLSNIVYLLIIISVSLIFMPAEIRNKVLAMHGSIIKKFKK